MRGYELAFEAEPFEAYTQPGSGRPRVDAERPDGAWQVGIRRNAPAYIRWVQTSLNQLRGPNLPLSGVMSATTRSTLRQFQQQQGLPTDGMAGPETEKILVAMKARQSGQGVEPLEFDALGEADLADPNVGGEINPTPMPGRYYQIKRGDNLLKVAGLAYKAKPGTKERLEGARRINKDPKNQRFFRAAESDTLFPSGKVSFLARFTCDVGAQMRAEGKVPSGRCYAVLWIPPGHIEPEDRACGLPRRTVLEEITRELDSKDLEQTRPSATVQPRLCLFQNSSETSHRHHFQCGAMRQARRIGAIASPDVANCLWRVGATPYNSGAEIIGAIEAAFQCLGKRAIDTVHIFSHGFSSGIPGTTSGFAGLYTDSFPRVDRGDGGRTVRDVPTAPLSNNAVFVLHGCNIAAGTDNFARALYEHLARSLSNPTVYGHHNGGCASRNDSWREYSNHSPTGRNIRSIRHDTSVGCC